MSKQCVQKQTAFSPERPSLFLTRSLSSHPTVLGVLGLLLLLAIWWLGIYWFGGTLAKQFAPEQAVTTTFRLLGDGDIWLHILLSLKRVAIGLAIALLLGIPTGLLVGFSTSISALLSPAFQFLRMVSPLSWMPIAVMAFGIGDAPIYFLLSFAAVWPIIINTAAGVQALNTKWLALGLSLSATRFETLTHIVAPGIFSHVLTGTRLAIGIVWIVLVPSEMLGVDAGLGYFVLDTRDRMAYSELMAVILIIGMLGFALDSLMRWAFKKWQY
ncbi:ABC transporter permease [Paenalcaligenes niemegkensis]|uniref:ABC transporter permease n=1 Tax=Paenalcaligenes niemegkensis TaxID=2895469 RepID=UPI001EE91CE6|nr:ABC transporter permease [Paenalcaligenes niemegkensis]MCQ9616660.1 ABC transporter permease [Paenalcaligenes niemegkensis]